jgi:hypothetical protein
MQGELGGAGRDSEVFVLPVNCMNRPRYIMFGDLIPGASADHLMMQLTAFAEQAGLVLEKLMLEEKLRAVMPAVG